MSHMTSPRGLVNGNHGMAVNGSNNRSISPAVTPRGSVLNGGSNGNVNGSSLTPRGGTYAQDNGRLISPRGASVTQYINGVTANSGNIPANSGGVPANSNSIPANKGLPKLNISKITNGANGGQNSRSPTGQTGPNGGARVWVRKRNECLARAFFEWMHAASLMRMSGGRVSVYVCV